MLFTRGANTLTSSSTIDRLHLADCTGWQNWQQPFFRGYAVLRWKPGSCYTALNRSTLITSNSVLKITQESMSYVCERLEMAVFKQSWTYTRRVGPVNYRPRLLQFQYPGIMGGTSSPTEYDFNSTHYPDRVYYILVLCQATCQSC